MSHHFFEQAAKDFFEDTDCVSRRKSSWNQPSDDRFSNDSLESQRDQNGGEKTNKGNSTACLLQM